MVVAVSVTIAVRILCCIVGECIVFVRYSVFVRVSPTSWVVREVVALVSVFVVTVPVTISVVPLRCIDREFVAVVAVRIPKIGLPLFK